MSLSNFDVSYYGCSQAVKFEDTALNVELMGYSDKSGKSYTAAINSNSEEISPEQEGKPVAEMNAVHIKDEMLRYALKSLSDYTGCSAVENIDEYSLKLWIANMIASGIKPSTLRRYFGKLHSEYKTISASEFAAEVKRKSQKRNDPFKAVQGIVDFKPQVNRSNVRSNLARIKELIEQSGPEHKDDAMSIFLYLLYDVRATFADIVRLNVKETAFICQQIDELIENRLAVPGKYIYRLNQGKQREGAIIRRMVADLHRRLKECGLNFPDGFSRESIAGLWIEAAIDAGIPLSEIRSITPRIPEGYDFLELVEADKIDDAKILSIIRKVANSIDDNTSQWFVMRMRQGVNPDIIKEAIARWSEPVFSSMDFYYPTHIEHRRSGRKMIKVERPYIPGLLFFRTRRNCVGPIFSRIGDKAWCYRTSNSPSSPYSAISLREMNILQRHIGMFTPDIKIETTEPIMKYSPGDRVRINGGILMDGREGIITRVRNNDGTITCMLRLSDSESIQWTVEVDELFLESV